jgi:hypothetical protein
MKKRTEKYLRNLESLLKIALPDYSNMESPYSENTFDTESKVFDVDFDNILSGYTDKVSFLDFLINDFNQALLNSSWSDILILEKRLKYLKFEKKKIELLTNTFTPDLVIDISDTRINCNEDKSTIKNYFMILTEIIGDDKINPIMSVENVIKFLHANFINFSPKGQIVKLEINFTKKGQFRYFIFNFFKKEITNNGENEKKNYINLLINNFTLFDNSTRKSVSSNFARKPKNLFFEL